MVQNPFEVTKAVDFTDDEIAANFVSFFGSEDGEYTPIANPSSPMPQFLVGGKGGGRTHLMRYFSYPLQKNRGEDLMHQLAEDGYIGIYFRCSGLNGSRFSGKRQSEDIWCDIFSYYMDIWLTEHLLNTLLDINSSQKLWGLSPQANFSNAVRSVLSRPSEREPLELSASPLADLRNDIVDLRQRMDRAINNVAMSGVLDIEILAAPGKLIFESAKAAVGNLSNLSGLKFTFLIDEFENLSIWQQRYVNTLIREKELPVCFLIGGRQWGIRTQDTLSAGEVNKAGSEFEWIVLEDKYRGAKQQSINNSFHEFCTKLAVSRLKAHGYKSVSEESLKKVFDGPADDRLRDEYTLDLLSSYKPLERPYLTRLHEQVVAATRSPQFASEVCGVLSFGSSPLAEKIAIFRFYQKWKSSGRVPSLEDANFAAEFARDVQSPNSTEESRNFLKLWKNDLLSQISRECSQKIPYLGFAQFVEMSGFLPRSFLTILKYITYWAQFYGEDPFTAGNSISARAQISGVLDAAKWFSIDALPIGPDGEDCDRSMRRLGMLFQRMRYADKPSEVSCSAFSTNTSGLSLSALDRLQKCVDHNLLVEIESGRAARNTGSRHRKFQIHPMIAPFYGLSTSRRGELAMRPHEVNAIFDSSVDESVYAAVAKRRLAPLNAPFGVVVDVQEALF